MTPNDIQNKRFDKGMGGYKVDDVNAYLQEIADHIRGLQEEKGELEKKLVVLAEKLEEYREDEESLRAALIGAQKLGDSVVRDAKKKAEALLEEANNKAAGLVADAKSNIDKETLALSKMQGEVAAFRNQILNLYKRQIELIEQGPYDIFAAAGQRPAKGAVLSMPEKPEKAERQNAAASKESKVNEFVLHYEEEPDDSPKAEDAPASGKQHKRQSYGNLRFGEEYNLTRKE